MRSRARKPDLTTIPLGAPKPDDDTADVLAEIEADPASGIGSVACLLYPLF